METKNKPDEYNKGEIEHRMTGAIQRALATPPKPFTKPVKGKVKGKQKKGASKAKAR